MLYTVHFNYLNILQFSMKVDAESKEEALRIIKGAIAENKTLVFIEHPKIKLDQLQVEDVDHYFSISIDKTISSKYCYLYDDDDEEPTKPDCPCPLIKKNN